MKTFSIQHAQYTPAEVEAITGVAVDLQRNWRRRGFLPTSKDGKHARFGADDIAYLMALKAFSEATPGVAISEIYELASLAVLPITGFIAKSYAIEMQEPRIASLSSSGDPLAMRYIVKAGAHHLRVAKLGALDEAAEEDQFVSMTRVVFDCLMAASIIVSRVPRPVLTLLTEHAIDAPAAAPGTTAKKETRR